MVREGVWIYDGSVAQPVDIVALDFDFWFTIAEADGALEADEAPQAFGPDGWLYYHRFTRAGDRSEPTWVDSPGYATIDEAVVSAEARVPSPIVWS